MPEAYTEFPWLLTGNWFLPKSASLQWDTKRANHLDMLAKYGPRTSRILRTATTEGFIQTLAFSRFTFLSEIRGITLPTVTEWFLKTILHKHTLSSLYNVKWLQMLSTQHVYLLGIISPASIYHILRTCHSNSQASEKLSTTSFQPSK